MKHHWVFISRDTFSELYQCSKCKEPFNQPANSLAFTAPLHGCPGSDLRPDALRQDPLDSNDLRAWQSLADRQYERIRKLESSLDRCNQILNSF